MRDRAARLFAGFDFGQAFDYSALAVVERLPADAPTPRRRFQYTVVYLRVWDLNTDYERVAADAADIFARDPLPGTPLALDFTGVGRAVAGQFRSAGVPAKLRLMTVTSGNDPKEDADTGELKIPKRELISNAVALFHSRLVKIARLPDPRQSPDQRRRDPAALSDRLRKELANFRAKQDRRTGHESFEAERAADHDDLVSAVAMAVYLGERYGGRASDVSVAAEAESHALSAPPGVFPSETLSRWGVRL